MAFVLQKQFIFTSFFLKEIFLKKKTTKIIHRTLSPTIYFSQVRIAPIHFSTMI